MKNEKLGLTLCFMTVALLNACSDDSGSTSGIPSCEETCVICDNGVCKDQPTCEASCVHCENGVCKDQPTCEASCVNCDNGVCKDQTNPEVKCDPACGTHEVCSNGNCVPDVNNHACSQCLETETCVEGQCVDVATACEACGPNTVCVGGICYAPSSACAKCSQNQVCRGEVCYDATDYCATCASDQACSDSVCEALSNPCAACTADQICVNNACVACENEVCGGLCCNYEDDVCDAFTQACVSYGGEDFPIVCNNNYCRAEEVCTSEGKCDRVCSDQRNSCGEKHVCCDAATECYNDSYCRVTCEGRAICGSEKNEICCAFGEVCENNRCLIACPADTGVRCGKDQEFCCDSATEICAFNKCVTPTKTGSCENDNDCDYWSVCDSTTKKCVSADADDNACIYNPPVGKFLPKQKWHYDDEIAGSPIVINLTDDNGDGKVDENDIPDVVFVNNSFVLKALNGKDGTLIAETHIADFCREDDISAADINNDGVIEVLVPTAEATQEKTGLYALQLKKNDAGEYAWIKKEFINATIDSATNSRYWADLHPTPADVNSDGMPEIVTSRGVIKGDDWSKFQCTIKLGQVYAWYHYLFAVADLDQDGKMEIVETDIYDATTTGGGACDKLLDHAEIAQSYNSEGKAASNQYWYTAVADLIPDSADAAQTGELVPEIVRVRSGYVSVWKVYKKDGKWSQRLIWETHHTSQTGGGNPVIADFDGDGQRDIGVAGKTHYSVFNGQTGKMVWAAATTDASSEKTGSSVFDFEGDGVAEVIYRDETRIRIYSGEGAGYDGVDAEGNPKPIDDGRYNSDDFTVFRIDKVNNVYTRTDIYNQNDGYMDPRVLWWEPSQSGTVIEYPLIVDVDNDGRTEIVVSSETRSQYSDPSKTLYYLDTKWADYKGGITVYGDSSDNWVRTRRIWNQHSYHVTNINEDGTVPQHEEANWLNPHLNNYRMNVQPAKNFAPDFVPGDFVSSPDGCKNDPKTIHISASVKNVGSQGVSAPVGMTFFIDNYVCEDASLGCTVGNTYTLKVKVEESETAQSIPVGGSASVEFDWDMSASFAAGKEAFTIYNIDLKKYKMSFTVDDSEAISSYVSFHECHEDNNTSIPHEVKSCPEGEIY